MEIPWDADRHGHAVHHGREYRGDGRRHRAELGGFFQWGDRIPWTVTVDDPEDTTIDCTRVAATFVLGHDTHGHASETQMGCSGVFQTDTSDAAGGSATRLAWLRRLLPGLIPLHLHHDAGRRTHCPRRRARHGGRGRLRHLTDAGARVLAEVHHARHRQVVLRAFSLAGGDVEVGVTCELRLAAEHKTQPESYREESMHAAI
jgi:hypothetical protein